MLKNPETPQEKSVLNQINDLGEKCSALFDGVAPVVVFNVAAALLACAMKVTGLTKQHAYDCVDTHWDSAEGFRIRRP
jgi:hypothetical protein